jgi:hypothetical protein
MTYQDALKARARIAYGQVKTAAEEAPYMGSNPMENAIARGMQAESDLRQATQYADMLDAATDVDLKNAKNKADEAVAQRDLAYGIGAGAVGGLGIAGGAYGLTGLFPSLKKRRLLRALIALGAGAAGGAGIGYAVNAGLSSGKIQSGYRDASDAVKSAWGKVKTKAGDAYDAAKNALGGGKKTEEATDESAKGAQ